MESRASLPEGTKVKLGDGRKGVVVGKRERAGFHGYIVRITESIDSNQIGQTVGATIDGMQKLSQLIVQQPQQQQPPTETEPVEGIEGEELEEKLKKQEEYLKSLTQLRQTELQKLQQTIAQLKTRVGQLVKQDIAQDQFQNLERLEQDEQEDLQEQQETTLQQQEMQQQKQQSQQEQNTQQLQLQQIQKQAWVKAERANISVKVGNIHICCDVAATPRQQASGLQAYETLVEDHGLWFPFSNRRTASFHMGEVKFPIDIVFVDGSRISRIVANVQPNQSGSWTSVCTDVIEVNGGWCKASGIAVGDSVVTPLTGKKRAYSDIERTVNTSNRTSYDPLRTLTEAENQGDSFEQELMQTFPFLKEAQENRQVKPITYNMEPGDKERRNQETRFLHQTTPDISSPEGQDNPNLTMGDELSILDGTISGGDFARHFKLQRGYDPTVFREEDYPVAIRPSAQIKLQTPGVNELLGVDAQRLAMGSIKLYDTHGPEWQEEEDPRGYSKMAIIGDNLISNWVDSLGFDEENEARLRKVMFTNEFKRLLGNALSESGRIVNYELFDSDLLVYR